MKNLTHSIRFIGSIGTLALLSSPTCLAAATPNAGAVQLGIRGTVVQSTTVETSGPNAPPKSSTTEIGLLGKGTLAAGYLLSDQVLLGLKLVDVSRVEPNLEYWFAPGSLTPYAGFFVGYGNASSKDAGANELHAGLELGVHTFVKSGLSLDANIFGAYGSASRGPSGAKLKSTDTSFGLLVGLSVWPSAHADSPPNDASRKFESRDGEINMPGGRAATSRPQKAPPQQAIVHTTEQDGLFSLSASFPNAEHGSLRMILAFRPAEDADALTLLLSREAPLTTTEATCGSSFISAGDQTAPLSELIPKIEKSFQSVQVTQRGKVPVANINLLSEAAPVIGVCKDSWPVTGQAREQIKSFLTRVNARVAKDAAEREAKAADERAKLPAGSKSTKKGSARKSAP